LFAICFRDILYIFTNWKYFFDSRGPNGGFMQGKKEPQQLISVAENGRTWPEPKTDIAIIGMACRFPGANSHEEFWENLIQGRTSIRIIPEERWDWRDYWGDPQTEANKTNSKWGGFMDHVAAFDPDFFGLSAREVESMDPQQRIALELSWSCFEDAGIRPSRISGESIGVFIGAANFDYKELQEKESYPIEAHYALGVAASVITSRISYFFNFTGPSFPLDTACSSSLNAIHAAIQSIRQGECGMALAGGVSLLLTPPRYISFAKMGVLSPTGSCKTFDADADGIVRGEGAGLILLKPLLKALEDGDLIYGIVKGSAINHSGKTPTLSYPSPQHQAEVIVQALNRAEVAPESISYIEAHGTGTPKGDPIEFQGLVSAFQWSFSQRGTGLKKGYCGLGSVKPNIGHLESAAGIAGVIKVLLALKYRLIPGTQNFKRLNPQIAISDSPFYITDRLQEWQPSRDENQQVFPRRAGVSAFGFSGTNAHVIIEEAPPIPKPPRPQLPAYLICLSAKTEAALRQKEQDLACWLHKEGPEQNLPDISATLLWGREHFKIRSAILAGDMQELREKLTEIVENGQTAGYFTKKNSEWRELSLPLSKESGARNFSETFQAAFGELAARATVNKQEYINHLKILAALYVQGDDPDWNALFPDIKGQRISLPTYPFAREHYWIPVPDRAGEYHRALQPGNHPLKPALGAGRTGKGEAPRNKVSGAGLNQWLAKLLFVQMNQLGMFDHRTSPLEPAELREMAGIIPKYDRWLKECLRILEDYGFVHYEAGWKKTAENPVGLDGAKIWRDWDVSKVKYLQDPDQRARVILTDICLRKLPQVLTGNIPATDVLFPNSSMEMVTGIYKDNAVSNYFNTILADAVKACVKQRLQADAPAKVRIIEVGAGTGSTSEMVLTKLNNWAGHIEYAYTDISKAFLLLAEEKYGPDHPCLAFKLWNIEKPPEEQGIEAGAYDIAIAANVLHATRNIRQTLRNIKAALKTNGVLLVNEITQKTLFTTLTFGLLDGWWLYDDEDLRIPGSPLLSRESWQKVLAEEGFHPIDFPAESGGQWGQQVICAGNDRVLGLAAEKITDNWLREKSTLYFKKLIGSVLRIPFYKIDAAEPLERYGIDSILISQLNTVLRQSFAKIGNTLFDEYPTIDLLVEHFIQTRRQSLVKLVGCAAAEPELEEYTPEDGQLPVAASSIPANPPPKKTVRLLRFRDLATNSPEAASGRELIAIIGMSGRFPQAQNLSEYWENLLAGKSCITEIPGDRWPLQGFYHPDRREAIVHNQSYSKWGAFLDDYRQFDSLFFNMAPREAEMTDPQELLFLEECWRAMEDAGYAPSKLPLAIRQRTGVFGGITEPGSSMTWFSSMVNRVSYFLNLQGPSIPVDAMCSSSLVAIHEACEYIRQGKGDLAIAGGVNIYSNPAAYIKLAALQIISGTSQGTAFQKGGTGFIPGEGVGVVILKAYPQAVRDGDHIYAVIRGTAINHKGKTNGFLAPGLNQLAAVIQQALAQNHTDPRTIGYIEAAASGSEMMDEVETAALMKVFGSRAQTSGMYKIGSVKSNIGHCESASGMSQLLKVILSLNHRTLVPTLVSGDLNPNIDFKQLPFQLQREVAEWEPVVVDGVPVPRRAGITNVGLGGVNAHIIVEEYLEESGSAAKIPAKAGPVLFILSAKTKGRLIEYVRLWVQYFNQNPDADLKNIAYTLQVGREEMNYRLAVTAGIQADLIAKLNQWLENPENMDDCHYGDLNTTKIIFKEVAGQLIKTGNLTEIAKLWVLGNSIPWQDLYQSMKPRRVSRLPAYPFERANARANFASQQKPGSWAQINEASASLETDAGCPEMANCQLYQASPRVEKKVAEILKTELGIKHLNLHDNLRNLGMNSLIFVKIVNAIEKTYQIEFDFENLYPECFETLQSMIHYVVKKVG
jgi:polyketide synthase PksN